MPRYDILNVREVKLLTNTVSISNQSVIPHGRKLDRYDNISPDARVDWSGDIVINENEQDFDFVFTIDSYVQNMYHRLITQLGQHPEDGTYGWDFNYLYQMSVVDQEKSLPSVIRSVRDAALRDFDTLAVVNVSAYVERINTSMHNIIIELTVRPRSLKDTIQVVFELDGTTLGNGA